MPAPDDDALLRLIAAGGPVAPRRTLLAAFGSAETALQAGTSAWREAGLDAVQARALRKPDVEQDDQIARGRHWLIEAGHRLIGWHDADYPALLRRIASPPLVLFVAGNAELLWHPGIAIVGSRSPTVGGRDNARHFARAFARAGFGVTSGLAAGIDTAAHEGALDIGGLTVAVLGTGPDVPYPRGNAGLLQRILANGGAVVSEHPPGTPPRPGNFPSRNRILAGLALGTLVVEAAQRSGALITARLAAEGGREVFALPGSIHNPLSRGCHRLIRDGAGLVERPDEVIAALGPVAAELADALRSRLRPPPSDPSAPDRPSAPVSAADTVDHQRLWAALGHDPSPMDALAERSGLTVAELSSMLLVMELEGRVAVEHGRYSRRGPA